MSVIKFLVLLAIYGLIQLGDWVILQISGIQRALVSGAVLLVKLLVKFGTATLEVLRLPLKLQIRFSIPLIKKKKRKKIRKKSPKKNLIVSHSHWKIKISYFAMGMVISLVFFFTPLLGYIFIADLPSPYSLSVEYIPKTTKIYDRNGELLYEIYANQNRTLVELNNIPKNLINATIAIEDAHFYSHPGFDLKGISRAFISNLRNNELQGGSTITQQLVKSALLSPEATIQRKIKEIVIAFWAERIYSKDQILEMYFNYVPYGGTAWGIQAASQVYFNKNVSELSLAESSYLAGLPKAPSLYSPFGNSPSLGKKRQKDVLEAMVKNGYITQKQAHDAYKQELTFNTPEIPLKAPHFVMYVKEKLIEEYGLSKVEKGGLNVITTIDMNIQRMAEKVVSEEVEKNKSLRISNGAALITDPATGQILAMVGSKDFFDKEHEGNVNLTTSLRQPGSTIKIVTYALALKSGFTEATIINDAPLSIVLSDGKIYAPVNYGGKYHGQQVLRNAFANSFNTSAVRVAQELGVDTIVAFGKQMGISSWEDADRYGLSITLGGGETTMIDLATAYGTVANGGKRVDIYPILSITEPFGKTLFTKNLEATQVISSEVSFILSDILADNQARSQEFGLNSPLHIPGQRVSVKTGTTDNKRDNWTIGFTKDFVIATWVGNNDNSPMSQNLTSGITGAAPMWNKLAVKMLEMYPATDPVQIPAGIVQKFCLGRNRYFVKGTEDLVTCNYPSVTPSPVH